MEGKGSTAFWLFRWDLLAFEILSLVTYSL